MEYFDWVSSPTFWLPKGYTWENVKNPSDSGIRFPEVIELLYPFPLALFLLVLRHTVEQYLLRPFGRRLGLVSRTKTSPSSNPILEECFVRTNGRGPSSSQELTELCDQTQLNQRTIQRWFRTRASSTKSSKLIKFSESMWRASCYASMLSIGLVILWDKPWLWDFSYCLSNYPNHDVTPDLRLYYLAGSSLYLSFALSQFSDVKRKDFWEMFLHHITTLLLMSLSWISNFVRVGTFVLLLHDLADVPLEFAKAASYPKKATIRDTCFGLFVIVWTLTRLILFPYFVVVNYNYGLEYQLDFPVYHILKYLLFVLFCLHVFWSYLILKMLVRAYSKGNSVEHDSRSSTDTSDKENSDNDNVTSNGIEKKEL